MSMTWPSLRSFHWIWESNRIWLYSNIQFVSLHQLLNTRKNRISSDSAMNESREDTRKNMKLSGLSPSFKFFSKLRQECFMVWALFNRMKNTFGCHISSNRTQFYTTTLKCIISIQVDNISIWNKKKTISKEKLQ